MALIIGSPSADSGMSKAVFDPLDQLLSPPLQQAVDAAGPDAKPAAQAALDAARDGWRKLAFAVAKGVVEHLVASLEVTGVTVAGTVSVPVSGNTGPTNAHLHAISLNPSVSVALTQNNDGTGRVR